MQLSCCSFRLSQVIWRMTSPGLCLPESMPDKDQVILPAKKNCHKCKRTSSAAHIEPVCIATKAQYSASEGWTGYIQTCQLMSKGGTLMLSWWPSAAATGLPWQASVFTVLYARFKGTVMNLNPVTSLAGHVQAATPRVWKPSNLETLKRHSTHVPKCSIH